MKKWIAALIAFLVIGVGTGTGFYIWGEAEGSDQGYSTGCDIGYDIGYNIGYTLGWDASYDIGWNEGHAVPLQLFESLVELTDWLFQDDTNSMTFIPDTFDCDDFAMRLSQNASNDGYFIGLYHEREVRHMKNFACIKGKTNVIFLIEPQHDRITPLQVD